MKVKRGGNTYEHDRDRKIRKIRKESKNPIETPLLPTRLSLFFLEGWFVLIVIPPACRSLNTAMA